MPSIKYTNHAGLIIDKISRSREYCDFLLKASDHWNRINSQYGIPLAYLSLSEYEELKTNIELNRGFYNNGGVEKLARQLFPKVKRYVGGDARLNGTELRISAFFMANFNACNTNGIIALSLDKLHKDDLPRVLTHELTHWICNRLYKYNPHGDLVQLLLSEGSACFVSQKICGVPPARALGLQETTYRHYEAIENKLKAMFKDHICGSFLELQETPKHSTFKLVPKYHPFQISKDNSFNKYGYFLGYRFVEKCIQDSVSMTDIFTEHKETEDRLRYFLTDTSQ